jgi:hypothetical protein
VLKVTTFSLPILKSILLFGNFDVKNDLSAIAVGEGNEAKMVRSKQMFWKLTALQMSSDDFMT